MPASVLLLAAFLIKLPPLLSLLAATLLPTLLTYLRVPTRPSLCMPVCGLFA